MIESRRSSRRIKGLHVDRRVRQRMAWTKSPGERIAQRAGPASRPAPWLRARCPSSQVSHEERAKLILVERPGGNAVKGHVGHDVAVISDATVPVAIEADLERLVAVPSAATELIVGQRIKRIHVAPPIG